MLTLKNVTPVRLIKNDFFRQIHQAIQNGASTEEQKKILGRGRAKKGMFEGNLIEGELEIGQVSSLINDIKPVQEIIQNILLEYQLAKNEIQEAKFNF